MPAIWDKTAETMTIVGGFSNSSLIVVERNRAPRAARLLELRGNALNQLTIPENLWDSFRATRMWVEIAPCLISDRALKIIGKGYNNCGIVFYELTEEIMI